MATSKKKSTAKKTAKKSSGKASKGATGSKAAKSGKPAKASGKSARAKTQGPALTTTEKQRLLKPLTGFGDLIGRLSTTWKAHGRSIRVPGLTPASRYIYNVPQRASWQGERARTELLRELTAPPELLVVQHHDVFPFVTGNELDSARAVATFPELAALLASRYAKEPTLEDFDVYRLQAVP